MMSLFNLEESSKIPFVVIKDATFNQLGMATSVFEKSGVLAFLSDVKFIKDVLSNVSVTAVLTTQDIYELLKDDLKNYGVLIAEQPKKVFYQIHNYLSQHQFYWKTFNNDIDSSSVIDPNALIADHSVKIGKNVLIEAQVIINPGVIIGDDVILRSGTIIGSHGFQFLNQDQQVTAVISAGMVLIGNRVEIQHQCCVDRGVLGGTTIIKDDVKIDNFVHIAHDCIIGDRTFITAGVKFGGRTVVGKDCWLGINATISNGLFIGDDVTISLGSVVTRDVDSGKTVTGNFAVDHDRFIQFIKSIR